MLTHLERPRVEYLYNIKNLSFDSAKSQAVKEVLKAFGFENTGIKRAEKVGVVGVGDESKILLAISTLMQGYRTESEVTQILSDFAEDLEKNWAVVAEAIQTILRREGYPNPYEALKGLTRTNLVINKEVIHDFINTLEVSDAIKSELMKITPSNYSGI